ncbi:transporter substrate-binding domain-containing protein [Duganella sp. FT135W]|uniref:Transporter substrate-binding domain-containing protein n=1 Tax=Duganella flavida TaxID=2692175 RepID=A0A6L8K9S5_9BURK|nr:transporter substrate-binding domain-containing protein [Duganella flavida]MYM22652.1 transporter substrate-binding domain-containing protein [Duganella flavida]
MMPNSNCQPISGHRLRCGGILVILLFNLVAAAVYAAPGAEVVRLGTQDRAPYGYFQADGSFNGLAVQIVSCTMKGMEQHYSLSVYPWERAQVMAKNDQLDGFFPASDRPDRVDWTQGSLPIADQQWVWYLRADSKLDPSSAEFKQQAKVGAHFGSARLKMLEREQYHIVLSSQTDKRLLRAFMAGRADAIIGSDLALRHAAQELKINLDEIKIVPVRSTPQRVFFSKVFLARHPGFLSRFNAQIPACRKAYASADR